MRQHKLTVLFINRVVIMLDISVRRVLRADTPDSRIDIGHGKNVGGLLSVFSHKSINVEPTFITGCRVL